MQSFFIQILSLISKLTNKKVLYLSGTYANENNLAVKTAFGFWYCGNVFTYSDIAYGFANHGTIEEFDMRLVAKILNNSKKESSYIFYDVGSNTGPYSLLAATTRETIEIHSFDPVKEHLDTLLLSSQLNRFEDKITTHEIGLSNQNKDELFYLAGSGSTLEKDFIPKNTPTRIVHLTTLDSYISNKNIPPPDFIKIDIEGHEFPALQGALQTIKNSKPVLFIEIALNLANIGRDFINPNYKKAFNLLSENNYEAYIANNNQLQKVNLDVEQDGVFMYLFLHKETHMQDKKLLERLCIN